MAVTTGEFVCVPDKSEARAHPLVPNLSRTRFPTDEIKKADMEAFISKVPTLQQVQVALFSDIKKSPLYKRTTNSERETEFAFDETVLPSVLFYMPPEDFAYKLPYGWSVFSWELFENKFESNCERDSVLRLWSTQVRTLDSAWKFMYYLVLIRGHNEIECRGSPRMKKGVNLISCRRRPPTSLVRDTWRQQFEFYYDQYYTKVNLHLEPRIKCQIQSIVPAMGFGSCASSPHVFLWISLDFEGGNPRCSFLKNAHGEFKGPAIFSEDLNNSESESEDGTTPVHYNLILYTFTKKAAVISAAMDMLVERADKNQAKLADLHKLYIREVLHMFVSKPGPHRKELVKIEIPKEMMPSMPGAQRETAYEEYNIQNYHSIALDLCGEAPQKVRIIEAKASELFLKDYPKEVVAYITLDSATAQGTRSNESDARTLESCTKQNLFRFLLSSPMHTEDDNEKTVEYTITKAKTAESRISRMPEPNNSNTAILVVKDEAFGIKSASSDTLTVLKNAGIKEVVLLIPERDFKIAALPSLSNSPNTKENLSLRLAMKQKIERVEDIHIEIRPVSGSFIARTPENVSPAPARTDPMKSVEEQADTHKTRNRFESPDRTLEIHKEKNPAMAELFKFQTRDSRARVPPLKLPTSPKRQSSDLLSRKVHSATHPPLPDLLRYIVVRIFTEADSSDKNNVHLPYKEFAYALVPSFNVNQENGEKKGGRICDVMYLPEGLVHTDQVWPLLQVE